MVDTYFVIFMLLCTYTEKKIRYEEMWLFRWPILFGFTVTNRQINA